MALTEELPIYKACYDLVLAVFNLVKNFKKEFKYTLGESLKNVGCVQDAAVAHWYHSATEEEAEKYFWVVVRMRGMFYF